MRAAVLTAINQPLTVLDLQQQAPRVGEARVTVKACGVCMSDWHIMSGHWPAKLPLVPGHEAAGIVESVGPGPSRVSVGDHVVFSFHPHCGHCRYCNAGRPSLCTGHNNTPAFAQHDGTTRLSYEGKAVGQMARIGTFSEKVVCSQEHLIPIGRDVPWTVAALIGCSVATGIGAAIRHAEIKAGSTVLVIACGGVGLNVVQGARLAGASQIFAVDISPAKLELARKFGATDCIDASDGGVRTRILMSAPEGVDYAFDALGSEATIQQALECLRPGGHAVVVGIPSIGARTAIEPFSMVFQEKTLSGSFYGSVRPEIDFPLIADLYKRRKIDIESLVGRTYSLDEINTAFGDMRSGAPGRGVIVFD